MQHTRSVAVAVPVAYRRMRFHFVERGTNFVVGSPSVDQRFDNHCRVYNNCSKMRDSAVEHFASEAIAARAVERDSARHFVSGCRRTKKRRCSTVELGLKNVKMYFNKKYLKNKRHTAILFIASIRTL